MTAFSAKMLARLQQWLGMDRVVAYTALSRGVQIIGSAGSVLLLVYFLSPVEQGYYYTLLSVALLQMLFELGFSVVIQQLAAHESVLCTFSSSSDGRISGDPQAQARLRSILRLTVRWYSSAALVMVLVILPVGILFFSRKALVADHVAWQGPWIAAVLAGSLNFFLTPFYSFLEGCNQIRQVAGARLWRALAVSVMSWGTLISGHGLYASAMVNLGAVLVGGGFLWQRRRLLLSLMRCPAAEHSVCWRAEVWPFQWKIAVSSLCSFLTVQVFTPILFIFRGPAEAGRLGISLSIAGYLPIVFLSWVTTKATPFGQLVRLGRLAELDRLFFGAVRKSSFLLVLTAALCMVSVMLAPYIAPRFEARIEPPYIFALLLLTTISSFLVQCMAIYLRSFKQEPYLVQSVVVAGLTLASVLLAAPRWGAAGMSVAYTDSNVTRPFQEANATPKPDP